MHETKKQLYLSKILICYNTKTEEIVEIESFYIDNEYN